MKRLFTKYMPVAVTALLVMTSSVSYSAGVALGATRVIYPENTREVAVQLINSGEKNRFLIQSWMENSQGEKTTDFAITPPLFVSKPKSENTIRVMYVGQPLPQDRETLYWFNSKSIPTVDYDKIKDINVLQIAILSKIKLFIRPNNLPISPEDALKQLSFAKQGNSLLIKNPSPYFITLVDMKIGEKNLDAAMVSPKDQITVTLPTQNSNNFSYQTINDYGAKTPRITTVLQ